MSTKVAWDARYSHPIPHTNEYYAKAMVGGILSCGLTHAAITPLDLVKCRVQVGVIKGSLFQGLKAIIAQEGAKGALLGVGPTFVGYGIQGAFKFGLYEYFKDAYSTLAGQENAVNYRGTIYLLGSASAEVVADIGLAPFEMIKVKMQTSRPGSFPTSFLPAFSQMNKLKAETGFPFRVLVPLWSRQIPYTMAKFFFFEKTVEAFYTHLFTAPKETYASSIQLGITFVSGFIAGTVCAIVSHPADNIVSLMAKPDNKGKGFATIAGELGVVKLFTSGLGIRVAMIGLMTSAQWFIYDQYKVAMGMGTTGGAVAKK